MAKRAIDLDGVPEFPPKPEPAVEMPPTTGLGIAHYVVVGGGGGTNHAPGAYGGGGGGASYTVGGGGTGGWGAAEQTIVIHNNVGDLPTAETVDAVIAAIEAEELDATIPGLGVVTDVEFEFGEMPQTGTIGSTLLGRLASVKHWFGK